MVRISYRNAMNLMAATGQVREVGTLTAVGMVCCDAVPFFVSAWSVVDAIESLSAAAAKVAVNGVQ